MGCEANRASTQALTKLVEPPALEQNRDSAGKSIFLLDNDAKTNQNIQTEQIYTPIELRYTYYMIQ